MIIEYNPMHCGHLYLLEQTRARLGAGTAVVGVMSGDFVQRGDFAVLRRHARAEAAVRSGVDLVLELPLPWAVSSAERFADGGVQVLAKTGLVTHLAFGSECGDAAALQEVAACLDSELYHAGLRRFLGEGMSFAACRQAVVGGILGETQAALLETPNNNLGAEYCKALLHHAPGIRPLTVPRRGDAHDTPVWEGGNPSATAIRKLLRSGERERALALMAPAMGEVYEKEEAAGRAPVFLENCERAVLARLRSMTEADFAALDEGREGLCNRLYGAGRAAVSLAEVLETAKTKRYAHARLRRMVLWAYLGLAPGEFPEKVPYLRVLAANETGRALLARMRGSASVPVLTKPNHVRRLDGDAQALFALEARAADLYALAYPNLAAAAGGSAWKEGPVIV
ncbi:MAG: nucleotidyltransferase family protein [Oscillospiraceae bacterium]|nr:nucleotidyltransferase family protein [Oscillospiraceae bacterium]